MLNSNAISQSCSRNLPKAVAISLMAAVTNALVTAGTKVLGDDMAVFAIVCCQYAIGLLLCLPLLGGVRGAKNEILRLTPGLFRLHLLRGVSGVAAFYAFYFAILQIPMAEATLLRFAAPLFVPLLVLIWKNKVMPTSRWPSLIVGFCGVLVILRPFGAQLSHWHLLGLLSALGLAVSMVSTRELVGRTSSTAIIFIYFLLGCICSLPLAIVHWTPLSPFNWSMLLTVGLGFFAAMQMNTRALKFAKPSEVSPVGYCNVVFAGFLGWWIWGQVPDVWAWLGSLLVVVGALLIFRSDNGNV
jgi:drug/metabolite transporter (DMT)-like permease